MTYISSHYQVLTSIVRYQALGKLTTLANQIASARKLNSNETKKLIKQAKQIVLWLQALDYSAYLTTDQINQIKWALVDISDQTEFPVAPLLGDVARPAILIGSGGGTTTVTNNYDAGVPVENLSIAIGTEDVFTLATSLGNSLLFHYVVTNGTAYRSGILNVVWNSTLADCSESSSPDIGASTNDLVLSVDINAGSVRVRATAASNTWQVFGTYYLVD